MNFLKHFCTHATSVKKQMAGKLVSVHLNFQHFRFGRKYVRIPGQITAFIRKPGEKPALFCYLCSGSNHLVAFLCIAYQHSIRTIFIFQALPGQNQRQNGE